MSLYDELGVNPDADADAIKRAHRKMAREHHPDAGGDAETFQRKQRAYLILADPEKRKRYDRTGEEETAPYNELLEATSALMGAFDQAIMEVGSDFRTVDVIHRTRVNLVKQRLECQKAQEDAVRSKEGIGMLLERISRKRPGADVLRNALVDRQGMLDDQVAALKQAEAVLDRAVLLTESYSFRVDPPPPQDDAGPTRTVGQPGVTSVFINNGGWRTVT